jgi:nitroreductase
VGPIDASTISLYDGLMTTRAMRRLSPDPIDQGTIEALLRAAQQGPSGGNIQPWQFLVLTDAADRAAMGVIYRECYDRYESALLAMIPPMKDEVEQRAWDRTVAASRHLAENLAEVPVHVLVVIPEMSMSISDEDGEMDIGSPLASVYPAVQNLMLAARGFGLGSTLTTVFRIQHERVCDTFGIPRGMSVVALVPVGRPLGRFGVARRRPVEKATHWGRWGERRPFTSKGYEAPGSGRT